MIISRSNSLIISAACHVSSFQKPHPPRSRSTSILREKASLDRIAEPVGNEDDWGGRTLAAMSATAEEGIELQPLMQRNCEQSASSSRLEALSEQNDPDIPTRIISNEQMEHNNQFWDREAAIEQGKDANKHHILSSEPSREGAISTKLDVSRNDNSKSSSNFSYTVHTVMGVGDTDTESQRLLTFADTGDDNSKNRDSILNVEEVDDGLQAARRLENGSETEEDELQFRIRISTSKIRWGVVPMPEEFYAQFGHQEDGVRLGHLSFGIEEQGVAPPHDDPEHLYA